jgi:hypothetical protein
VARDHLGCAMSELRGLPLAAGDADPADGPTELG